MLNMALFADSHLTSSIATLKDTETVLPPPAIDLTKPPFTEYSFPSHGDNVLLLIPTANEGKVQVLTDAFKKQNPRAATIYPMVVPAKSDVGEQPYDGAGLQGAYNRTSNALHTFANSPDDLAIITKRAIGTVIVATIENYIQISGVPRAVDYGVIMMHNANTGKTVTGVSHGVSVPEGYVSHARSFGFENSECHGRVSVGRVLAANVPGLDEADWHLVVVGRSRYELLREAIELLRIPW